MFNNLFKKKKKVLAEGPRLPVRVTVSDREFKPQEDITPLESVLIAQLFAIYFQPWLDLKSETPIEFIVRNNLTRHFRQKPPQI